MSGGPALPKCDMAAPGYARALQQRRYRGGERWFDRGRRIGGLRRDGYRRARDEMQESARAEEGGGRGAAGGRGRGHGG